MPIKIQLYKKTTTKQQIKNNKKETNNINHAPSSIIEFKNLSDYMDKIKAYCKDNKLMVVILQNDSYSLSESEIKKKNLKECDDKLINLLNNAFKGENADFYDYVDLSKFDSTEFEKKVYLETMKIPKGEVKTYKEIGEAIGSNGYRAVGNALNKNPIAIAVPCHRVVGSNMKLTGFRAGIDMKKQMLINEGVTIKNDKVIRN